MHFFNMVISSLLHDFVQQLLGHKIFLQKKQVK